jgi:hypothetical protein
MKHGFLMAALLFATYAQQTFAAEYDVKATGPGSIGIGLMSGGTIQMGPTIDEIKQILQAEGKKKEKLLRALSEKLKKQDKQLTFTATLINQFLLTTTGHSTPEKWQEAFAEITRRYITLETRMKAIPVTTDRIKELVAKAEAARNAARWDEADALLDQADQEASEKAQQAKQKAKEDSRQAASIKASRASFALLRFDRRKGATLLQAAFAQRSDDVSSETIWWLFEAGDAMVGG